ncbi:MAG: UDP-N-acetylmuramoyl-tripeptide--D-alanyl-D-alanine ligase [Anaerolineaceae bacterium]
MFTLADVLEPLTGTRFQNASLVLSEAVIDSRQAIPASLFVAIEGERVDGHNFVQDSFANGASLALVEKTIDPKIRVVDLRHPLPADFTFPEAPFALHVENTVKALQQVAAGWRRSLDLRVIGITGSVGKSTTKELVADVMSQRYRTVKNQGNLNNEIGLPLTLLKLTRGTQCAITEMGFYRPGEIQQLCEMALPQVGILTNIGTVHAEKAGSQEDIAMGKSELVKALPPAPFGTAILNYDDPWIRPMNALTKAMIFYYGLDPNADLWADNLEGHGLEGISFRLHYQREQFSLKIPLIGQHSVHTALRATAAGLVEGLSWEEIINGLQHSGNQLRLVAVKTQQGALMLDDTYNASPESTLAALNLLAEIPGRRIAVLGGMFELGPYERSGHELVGIRAAEIADQIFTLGEKGKMIADSAIRSGMSPQKVSSFENTDQVVEALRGLLKEGDVALVKGSHGLRMDRIVSNLEVEE